MSPNCRNWKSTQVSNSAAWAWDPESTGIRMQQSSGVERECLSCAAPLASFLSLTLWQSNLYPVNLQTKICILKYIHRILDTDLKMFMYPTCWRIQYVTREFYVRVEQMLTFYDNSSLLGPPFPGAVLSQSNRTWATDVILSFLVVAFKNFKRNSWKFI